MDPLRHQRLHIGWEGVTWCDSQKLPEPPSNMSDQLQAKPRRPSSKSFEIAVTLREVKTPVPPGPELGEAPDTPNDLGAPVTVLPSHDVGNPPPWKRHEAQHGPTNVRQTMDRLTDPCQSDPPCSSAAQVVLLHTWLGHPEKSWASGHLISRQSRLQYLGKVSFGILVY